MNLNISKDINMACESIKQSIKSQGMLAIIRCKILCLPVCYLKKRNKYQDIQNCNFACYFVSRNPSIQPT